MDCNRARRGDGRPAEGAEAEREIDVSAVERETLIESTRLSPGGAAIRIGPAARRHEERSAGCGLLARPSRSA